MANTSTSMQRAVLSAVQGGERIPALEAVRSSPELPAVVTKLIATDEQPVYDKFGNRTVETPSINYLRSRSSKIAQRSKNADHILTMLPDLELVRQVLISSILAPKDLVTVGLNYKINFDLIDPDLRSQVTALLRGHFETSYKIKDKLYDIIDRVLFLDGSYPIAVIPENAIDDLINGVNAYSNESGIIHAMKTFDSDYYLQPVGLLAGPDEGTGSLTSLESLYNLEVEVTKDQSIVSAKVPTLHFTDKGEVEGHSVLATHVRVTDNPRILALPDIKEALVRKRTSDIYGSSLESAFYTSNEGKKDRTIDSITDRELDQLLYKKRGAKKDYIGVVKTQDQLKRQSVSEPLILELPSEAVIPVFVPGIVNKHVGYFIVLDQNGYPVTAQTLSSFSGHAIMNSVNTNFTTTLLDATRRANNGDVDCMLQSHQHLITKTYTDVMVANLSARLRNSGYSSSAQLATNPEVYRIMMARDLANQQTNILWLPHETVTYFASEFDSNGVGISLTTKQEGTAALRATLQFANVRAGLRNSVGITKVRVNLDDEEIDSRRRIEEFVSEFMSQRQAALPYLVENPTDMISFVGQAGYEFEFTGSRIPTMEVERSEHASNYVKPDMDLANDLRKQHHMFYGITSEVLDNMNQPEHAVTAVNQSILLTKRVVQHQETFNPLITDLLRKITIATESLVHDINRIIYENTDKLILTDDLRSRVNTEEGVRDYVVGRFTREIIEGLEVTLVRPDMISSSNKTMDLEEYSKSLETVIQAYLSTSLFTGDNAGEMSSSIEELGAYLKDYLIRIKAEEIELHPEVGEILDTFKRPFKEIPVFQDALASLGAVLTASSNFKLKTKDLRDAATKVSEELGVGDQPGGDGGMSGNEGMGDGGDQSFEDFGGDIPPDEGEDDGFDNPPTEDDSTPDGGQDEGDPDDPVGF